MYIADKIELARAYDQAYRQAMDFKNSVTDITRLQKELWESIYKMDGNVMHIKGNLSLVAQDRS